MAESKRVEGRRSAASASAGQRREEARAPAHQPSKAKAAPAKEKAQRREAQQKKDKAQAAHAMGMAMTALPAMVPPLLSWGGAGGALDGRARKIQGAGQEPPIDEREETNPAAEESRTQTLAHIDELLTQMKVINKGAYQQANAWWQGNKQSFETGTGKVNVSSAVDEILKPLLESRRQALKRIEVAQVQDSKEDKERTRRLASVAENVRRDIDSIVNDKSFNSFIDPAVALLFEDEAPKESLFGKLLKFLGHGASEHEA